MSAILAPLPDVFRFLPWNAHHTNVATTWLIPARVCICRISRLGQPFRRFQRFDYVPKFQCNCTRSSRPVPFPTICIGICRTYTNFPWCPWISPYLPPYFYRFVEIDLQQPTAKIHCVFVLPEFLFKAFDSVFKFRQIWIQPIFERLPDFVWNCLVIVDRHVNPFQQCDRCDTSVTPFFPWLTRLSAFVTRHTFFCVPL